MNTRRGTSLIELLVVMSACTVTLSLTGVLLHRIMQIQTQSRKQFNAERDALRLSDQFRSDVHRASATIADNSAKDQKPFLHLNLSDGRVAEYSRSNDLVFRVESGNDEPIWREEYSFPGIEALKIEQKTTPERLALTVIRNANAQLPLNDKRLAKVGPPPTSLCVEATIGRNRRFDHGTTKQGAAK